jgi:hypothetical protein
MAITRTAQQMNLFGQLLKTAAGRQKLAAALGPSLRRRRDYMSIARKALMVETLPDGALPVYDKEFDETGRSFIEAYVIGEEGSDVIVRRNPKRVMVPTFEIASNPMIPITQIKERRFDIVARALNLAKATVGEAEDKYIFKLFDVIAAKAVAFGEALQPEFKEWAKQVKKNASVLADELIKRGFTIVSGGTDNHSMLVDLRSKYPDLTGKVAENALVAADITVNKNMVPYDTRSAFQTSGIRLGTPAITTRGAKEDLMVLIAELIEEVLNDPENEEVIARVRAKVNETMKDYPLFAY